MTNARSLRLKREVLTELNGAELAVVVGASHLCGLTDPCTHASVDASCPTLPVAVCTTPFVAYTTLCL